jgi:EAL domain-containing protein (putative c-di-GMP-specific phosphodiesterase class I)/GGDEF domain-containing protein
MPATIMPNTLELKSTLIPEVNGSSQYQDFVIDLSPNLLLKIMGGYQLKASDVTGKYFFDQERFSQLDIELPAVSDVMTTWPPHLSWANFYRQINHLLLAWLEDYKSGAHLDSAFALASYLTLQHHKKTDIDSKFLYLVMHLLARATNQFDQYKFHYIQNFDVETGLPNQELLLNLLHQHLHVNDNTSHLGIILVNLNINFDEESQLNAASSQLMRAAIQKIQQHLNNQATLFRVGPIEIAILIEPLNFVAQLNLIASKLAHAFESALDLENISLILKPYFGCVSSLNARHSAFAIYDSARLALHHAMINNYQIELYDQHITASFSNIHQLDEAIIEALQHNELESYLQPIISLPSESCANAELLLRWQSEDWQLVSPVRLIDAIYKKGFGKVFIRWLINTACQHIAELISTHQRSISLTINLSVTDLLDADLPVLLAQSISLWDIPAQNLIIEITEGDILVDEEKVAQVIDQIVALGCKLALDDFGTGYSSMTRLRSMPIDLVKIDQSFVRNIAHSPQDREIVESVVALAHSLGKQVVAEGVEDKACLDILKQMQCEKIQGYYYAKPMSFHEFSSWLTKFSSK